MKKGNLTREMVVAKFGEALIAKLDGEDCDFSNRLQTDGDEAVEFRAAVETPDGDYVIAYYYQSKKDLDACEGQLDNLTWAINGYEAD